MNKEDGHDMIEYTLMLGAVALAAAAMSLGIGDTLSSMWLFLNNRYAGS